MAAAKQDQCQHRQKEQQQAALQQVNGTGFRLDGTIVEELVPQRQHHEEADQQRRKDETGEETGAAPDIC